MSVSVSVDRTDLRTHPPRRWNVAVHGVIWLPRIVDKCRAAQAGTLGTYLYGQSPIDDAFLRKARIDYAAFSDIVRSVGADDAAVLARIETAAPGATERLRTWGAKLATKRALFMAVLDLDDGVDCTGWKKPVRSLGNLIFPLVVAILRVQRPTPR